MTHFWPLADTLSSSSPRTILSPSILKRGDLASSIPDLHLFHPARGEKPLCVWSLEIDIPLQAFPSGNQKRRMNGAGSKITMMSSPHQIDVPISTSKAQI